MPRHTRHSVDKVQPEIVEQLERTGHKVLDLSAVGGGCPDILCSRSGRSVLFEIKSDKSISHRKDKELRLSQKIFREEWKGAIRVVSTPIEAIEAMNEIIRGR